MYMITESYERAELHIREVHPKEGTSEYYASVGGRTHTALCTLTARFHDHPTPHIRDRDLSSVCKTCLKRYKKAVAKQ